MKYVLFCFLFVVCHGFVIANPLDLDVRSRTTVHTHYSAVIEHYQNENWRKLIHKCQDLITDFPGSPFSHEGYYYLGVAYYRLKEFEYANQAFSTYLKKELAPKFFDQVIRFKFDIAQAFEQGDRLHLFGWKKMPKWIAAYEQALFIYDEVIATLPRDDLTARSFHRKGVLLLRMKNYKASIEAFQTLIRRFPQHPLSAEGYLGIATVYLTQCENEFPDRNFLNLAEVNLRKFRSHFPMETRLIDAEKSLFRIKEQLATDLLKIAKFYVRTKKKGAAAIYYSTIINKYPETHLAVQSQKDLEKLNIAKLSLKKENDQKTIVHHNND